MVPGFTLEKLSLDVVPLCWFIGDWIRFCNVIGFENLWIHCPHVIGFVADIFFFHSGERIQKHSDSLPNSPDADGSHIRKEKGLKFCLPLSSSTKPVITSQILDNDAFLYFISKLNLANIMMAFDIILSTPKMSNYNMHSNH